MPDQTKSVVKSPSTQSANILQKKKEAKSADTEVERLWIVRLKVTEKRNAEHGIFASGTFNKKSASNCWRLLKLETKNLSLRKYGCNCHLSKKALSAQIVPAMPF